LALTGRVRLVLVMGDAGIGKTRFVAEGLARAAAGGVLTVGGGCLPLAAKPPLLPIADALATLSRLDGGACGCRESCRQRDLGRCRRGGAARSGWSW
jgi:hypothetical protein